MKRLDSNGYSHEEIRHALLSNRKIAFRYELLDKNESIIGNVTATGNIDYNANAEIKRVAGFKIKEWKDINYIDERIKPYFRIYYNQTWLEYPLGVFLISSPSRVSDGYSINRDIECYDKAIILREDRIDHRYLIEKNSNYIQEVKKILASAGITTMNIEESQMCTKIDIEFEIGTKKIEAINQLLQAINYTNLYFDENGTARASSYIRLENRIPEEEYRTDSQSIIKVGMKETLDIFDCPNKFVRYLENPEIDVLTSTYINNDPSSKLSTISRGRMIVDIDSVTDIADQKTLDEYVKRIAEEKQIYEDIEFCTALMPHHGFEDCLYIEHKDIGTNGKYIEYAWNMQLEIGGNMIHKCKKAVRI